MGGKTFGQMSDTEQEKFLLQLLNPNDPLFRKIGKRGFDELLGPRYDPSNKTTDQIRQDIMKLGKKTQSKTKKTVKAADGGTIDMSRGQAGYNFKGIF